MTPEVRGFSLVFNSTHKLFHRALEGLTAEQAMAKREGANPLLWVAAHMVSVRSSFARGLGATVTLPWAKSFARGAEVKDVAEWPALDEVRRAWDEAHVAFMERLETLTPEALAAETPIPSLDSTLLGVLGLAAVHDAYHIGQLGSGRRLHGLERLVG